MPDRTPRSILVTGATGYIGGRLVPELLAAGHRVRCLARTPARLDDRPWRQDVEVAEGDVTDRTSLAAALEGIDVAHYLVHSMDGAGSFEDRDRQAAETFRDAAAEAGVGRLVYLGGLGDDEDPTLSRHLTSRHEVGRVLADGPVPVTELRAAVIIGSGSASFEMLRSLVEVLPAMVTPRWVANRCQPTAVRDVLQYLVDVVDDPSTDDHIWEIGGPDVLTYHEMMQTYARCAGLRRRLIAPVPVLSPSLSSHWIGLVTPLPTGLARPLVESLVNEVVVDRHPIDPDFDHETLPFADAVELAVRRVADEQVLTRWDDAGTEGESAADPQPTDPGWAGGRTLVHTATATVPGSTDDLFAALDAVGGTGPGAGWDGPSALWSLRGAVDRVLGGRGRPRRRPDRRTLQVGDHVDAWVVEAHEPEALLRLRSTMRLPGEAWLEWRVAPAEDGGATLEQRVIFHPRGVLGRAYWYGLWPLDELLWQRVAAGRSAAAASPPSGSGELAPGVAG